jgi:hypothetical protein
MTYIAHKIAPYMQVMTYLLESWNTPAELYAQRNVGGPKVAAVRHIPFCEKEREPKDSVIA